MSRVLSTMLGQPRMTPAVLRRPAVDLASSRRCRVLLDSRASASGVKAACLTIGPVACSWTLRHHKAPRWSGSVRPALVTISPTGSGDGVLSSAGSVGVGPGAVAGDAGRNRLAGAGDLDRARGVRERRGEGPSTVRPSGSWGSVAGVAGAGLSWHLACWGRRRSVALSCGDGGAARPPCDALWTLTCSVISATMPAESDPETPGAMLISLSMPSSVAHSRLDACS